jgi:beta-galactosidase
MRTPVSTLSFSCLLSLVWAWTVHSQVEMSATTPDPRVILPDSVNGVQQSRISLNGSWHFTTMPGKEFWTDTSSAGWKPIRVPGEPMMQGFVIKHDVEFCYRKTLEIPGDFVGKRVFLRFNGVYGHARVWVNGRYVREHDGGFTSWDCDITEMVHPGLAAILTVGVRDPLDEISFGSGYAKHCIGGILRGVELIALPERHIRSFRTEVRFDSLYRNATLTVESALDRPAAAMLKLLLFDPAGKPVGLKSSTIRFSSARATGVAALPVDSPRHWDSEHPSLYTLRASLVQNGTTMEVVNRRIGFREVRVAGNRLCVNGMPVKLRGACRHDIHPTLGRSTTPEQDREDVLLAKEANLNFIRTSHYPPSREFLEYCDEFGIYVEEETAVCFVGTHRHEPYRSAGASQNDPAYTVRYFSQLGEMVDRDRNHPCVVLWSVGNENEYGLNFQAEYEYVKKADQSRPVMFSYPGTVPKDRTCYDIISIHYVDTDGSANQYGLEIRNFGLPKFPVLHDEWAHVPCYNTPTLTTDLNVRNFWGESMKMMWDGCFNSEGGIGGAIWGYIDEVFMLPDTVVGYGPWGILDIWRRKKPEFWLTKKAYSPVRVLQTRFASTRPGEDLIIPLENRFDHTNLAELQVQVTAGGVTSTVRGPDIRPHSRGSLTIPGNVIAGIEVKVQFLDQRLLGVDEELLTLGPVAEREGYAPRPIRVTESDTAIEAAGESFALTFSKRTGLVEKGLVQGQPIILSGPFLHLTAGGGKIDWAVDSLLDLTGNRWQMGEMVTKKGPNDLRVSVRGRAGSIDVSFATLVNGNGELSTAVDIPVVPERWREVGIQYLLGRDLSALSWERNALWSIYPEDHIGRPVGTASKLAPSTQREGYRERPAHPWASDTRDFFLFGKDGHESPLPVPVDFRTTKEHVFRYTLADPRTNQGVSVISDGRHAARAVVNADGTTTLIILSDWNYANLSWGNFEGVKRLASPYRGNVTLDLGRTEFVR